MRAALVLNFTKRDFVDRYAGSMLGASWAFVWPLVQILIFTLIFAQVMGARLPGSSDVYGYGTYLVAGILPWTAFASTVGRTTAVFLDQRAIITKISVSLPLLATYIALAETVTLLIGLALFTGFLALTGNPPTLDLLVLPLLIAVQQAFAFALGLIFACLVVFLRDVREMVGILLQVWFWMTPIVYVPAIVPESFRGLLAWNPATLFVDRYREAFVFDGPVDVSRLALLALLAALANLVAWRLARRLDGAIRDTL